MLGRSTRRTYRRPSGRLGGVTGLQLGADAGDVAQATPAGVLVETEALGDGVGPREEAELVGA